MHMTFAAKAHKAFDRRGARHLPVSLAGMARLGAPADETAHDAGKPGVAIGVQRLCPGVSALSLLLALIGRGTVHLSGRVHPRCLETRTPGR